MEPLLFLLFVYIFTGLAFARTGRRRLRRWRLDREMRAHAWKLIGANIEAACEVFGPPSEQYTGGRRRLYEWRTPWREDLLVSQIVADESGKIVDMHWHVRESIR
ncbi:MAG TPA: hypothetical protein VES20_07820 [Bryobacteraceae bacterium]|nr:hypothetical protein [Bryobacteraceae bacterium]